MPKLDTPMLRTLPVAGSFCKSCLWSCEWVGEGKADGRWSRMAYNVLIKSQSGRCFDLSSGSVEDGQC